MTIDKKEFVFWGSTIFFTLDCVINYFVSVPIYVCFSILLVVIFYIPGFLTKRDNVLFATNSLIFIIPFIINCFQFGFFKESFSDLLYILSFYGSFFLYSTQFTKCNFEEDRVIIFAILCFLLFIPTFFGLEEISTMEFDTSDIEFRRSYRQGFFRIAHIASYFFAFIVLYYLHKAGKFRIRNKIIILISISFLLLTGSRTSIAVLIIGLILYYFRKKFIVVGLLTISFAFLIVYNIDYLLKIFDDTILFQYISIVKTLSTNLSRLSRVIIWNSWWTEVQNFDFWDIIIGRGFNSSFDANERNIYNRIWFHNDFLSIFYSYGALGVLKYIFLFQRIYIKNKTEISSNIFIYLAFTSFWLSAIFNGFYYYFPSILLFLFYSMINKSNESRSFRN